MKIDITEAISALAPKGKYHFRNGDLENMEWFDDTVPKPSVGAIEAKLAELQAEYDANQYQRTRATEYPALAEQLDLLFHDMTAGKGTKSGNWYKAVNKVKTDNPKPE